MIFTKLEGSKLISKFLNRQMQNPSRIPQNPTQNQNVLSQMKLSALLSKFRLLPLNNEVKRP